MKLLVATAMLLALATGAARADNENCRKKSCWRAAASAAIDTT